MGLSKKAFLITILVCFSTYLSLYTFKAHAVSARRIYEDVETGVVFWTSTPAGSLFPWPKEPGVLLALCPAEGVDLFIYKYLIKTWLLAGFSILSWFVIGIYAFTANKRGIPSNQKEQKQFINNRTKSYLKSSPPIKHSNWIYVGLPYT